MEPCISISASPRALPMVMFEAENPDPAAGPVLEEICVHGNIYPWCFFSGMWPHIFLPNAVSRIKVVHKASQKLCNPQGVTKRDMGHPDMCWFWERAIAWPPLCWCRLNVRARGAALPWLEVTLKPVPPTRNAVSGHSEEGKNTPNSPPDAVSAPGPLGTITWGYACLLKA